jgi:hypothetical protein
VMKEWQGLIIVMKRDKDSNLRGYSTSITADEESLHISDKLELSGVAPLLCAGITTYSITSFECR